MGSLISKIVPELKHIAVPVEELHEDPENIRVHDDRSVEAVAESWNEFGQRKPIVALENGKVVAGNAGLAAARDLLGWSHVAVVRFRDDEEEKALRFAIADNRTAELSWFDQTRLKEAVRKLAAASPANTVGLGFSKDELKMMVGGLELGPGAGQGLIGGAPVQNRRSRRPGREARRHLSFRRDFPRRERMRLLLPGPGPPPSEHCVERLGSLRERRR